MRRCFAICILVFLGLLQATAAFADDSVIGTILEVEGNATVTPASGGKFFASMVDTPVHLNDVVQTSTATRVFILFIDDTRLTLGENAKLKIDNYIFDPKNNSDNKALYSIQGAFQYVSGLIGKKENPDVNINTPVGSIGIRGTDFWAGTLDDQYGVAVNEGRVALKTEAGEEVVNKGEGTSVRNRHSAPEHARAWSRERFQRISATVHLRRQAMVWQRIKSMKSRQKILRIRYKSYMTRHRGMTGGNNLQNAPRTDWQERQQKRKEERRVKQHGHRRE